ncbi:unnamed protein product [Clonostachys solani]|uniref:Uncharacterized protein n=1 Tax=Clonostachys solani TaxID=160281 RepID=A0A9N9Z2T1_9HYPO|nr:unnamed protein product [Clonostachys solani]
MTETFLAYGQEFGEGSREDFLVNFKEAMARTERRAANDMEYNQAAATINTDIATTNVEVSPELVAPDDLPEDQDGEAMLPRLAKHDEERGIIATDDDSMKNR